MKKIYVPFIVFIILSSCTSVKKYNEQIIGLHAVEDLRTDVDKLYKQLKKHHPKLYQYTPKAHLDFKFDSLKQTITQPLTTKDFYKKVAPIVTHIKQGHISVGYITKRLTKKERKLFKKQEFEFFDLDFEYLEDKLWVKNNYGKDSTLVGCEIVSIDKEPVSKLIKAYKTRFASDGFNTTLYNRYVSKGFSNLFLRDKGFIDSLSVTFKNKDSVFTKNFKRYLKDDSIADSLADSITIENVSPKKISKEEKKANQLAKRKKRKDNKTYGYLSKTNQYTRNFNFIGKDSTVAFMKIRSFTNGNYKKFYKKSFTKLDSAKTKFLVIDLRDNGGGRIAEIDYLYSFLTQNDYQFLNPSEVNTRLPFLKAIMSNTSPVGLKVLGAIFLPSILIDNLLKTSKKEGKIYYNFNKHTKVKPPNPLHFNGTIYVLINGNSFSASSTISTHLKATKRATFVGEETGGAYNGTVAGVYKIYELPTSKVRIRMGLMQIEAPQKQQPDGFGVKPDVEMIPTVADRIQKRDPELDWVLSDIYKNN